ncbi:MAG: DUF3667 domain-containing protein [Rhizomicrobium sp.]|jgi:hypothetical protein
MGAKETLMDDLTGIAELGEAAAVEMVASALAERGMRAESCRNCAAPLIGSFCATCGQEHDTHRRSVWGLLRTGVDEIGSLDSRSLRTAVALLVQPGELSLAFQEGRQRRYLPALRLYLFVSLVFFLVLSMTGLAIVQLQIVATPATVVTDTGGHSFLVAKGQSPTSIPDWMAKEPGPHYTTEPYIHFFARIGRFQTAMSPAARANLDRDMEGGMKSRAPDEWTEWIKSRVLHTIDTLIVNPAAVNVPLTAWIPRVLFILLPLYALLLAAFYWRQRKSYFFVDHLVFSLNVHSFVFVAILAAIGVAQFASPRWAALTAQAAIGVYLLLAIKRFYRQSWFWTGAKFAAVSFFYTAFFLMPAIVAVIATSLLEV